MATVSVSNLFDSQELFAQSNSFDVESRKLCVKPRGHSWCSLTTSSGAFTYWYAGLAPAEKYNYPEGACDAALRGLKVDPKNVTIVQKRSGCFDRFAKEITFYVSCDKFTTTVSGKDVRVVSPLVKGQRNCLVTVN